MSAEAGETPRRDHVAAIVTRDGDRLGYVVSRGRTYTATRRNGSADSVSLHGRGFRSVAAAIRWVEDST